MHGTLTRLDVVKSTPTYQRNMAVIDEAVESFTETGVARLQFLDYSNLPDDWTERRMFYRANRRSIASDQQVRSFIKRVAKDLKRPILTAELDGMWNGRKQVKLTVRYLKRNQVIMSPFHLLNDDKFSPVRVSRDTKNWYVFFHGLEGRQLFEKWFATAPTDEAFRKAMKLA